MDEQRLAEIERVTEAAIPEPWEVTIRGNTVQSHGIVHGLLNICSGISPKTNNAAFIALARSAVPELCAALREAWANTSVQLQAHIEAVDWRDEEIARLRAALEAVEAEVNRALNPINIWAGADYENLYYGVVGKIGRTAKAALHPPAEQP